MYDTQAQEKCLCWNIYSLLLIQYTVCFEPKVTGSLSVPSRILGNRKKLQQLNSREWVPVSI